MNKKSKLNRQLLRAVKTNSCDLIEPLLRQGADPLANDFRSLVVAIERGRVPILTKFVQHGIEIIQYQIHPLKTALEYDQLETLAFLLNTCLNFPSDLKAACLHEIRNDSVRAMAMLLAEMDKFYFPAVEECMENDSINWFRAIEHEFDLQPQAASIVTACVSHSATKILIHMLENYIADPQVLNGLLVRVACERSTDLLEILIHHGATDPDESTRAFSEAIKNSYSIPAAELLLPNIDIARIDDQDLTNLASCCEFDLVKQILRRGTPSSAYAVTPRYAIDLVLQIEPEDFFVFDDGFPLTEKFLKDRLGFCRDLAQAAAVFATHESEDKENEKIKIAIWMQRCMEIKNDFDIAAREAQQVRLA